MSQAIATRIAIYHVEGAKILFTSDKDVLLEIANEVSPERQSSYNPAFGLSVGDKLTLSDRDYQIVSIATHLYKNTVDAIENSRYGTSMYGNGEIFNYDLEIIYTVKEAG